MVASLTCVSACASAKYPLSQVPAFPSETAAPDTYTDEGQPEYRIGIGDALTIQSYFDQTLKQAVTVRPDGFISLILIGDVSVVGKTTRELDAELTRKYDQQLPAHPDVTVTVDQMAGMVVYIGGEVKAPTIEPIKGSITLLQSITAAGGFMPSSNTNQVVLLREGAGGHFRAYQIDANLPLRNQADEVYLRSHDVVFVPKTEIGEVDVFVDEYINQVVPKFVTTNFGYTFFDQVGGGSTVTVPPTTK
jgi:protein involved in polysaccharide export with SLBB domain